MDNRTHKKKCRNRILSGLMALMMVVSSFIGYGPALNVEAKEAEAKNAVVDLSVEGADDKGMVAIRFSDEKTSWQTVYEIRDGVTYLDGKETTETQVTLPRDEEVYVTVELDNYHYITGCTVQNTDGIDLVIPRVEEKVRTSYFTLSDIPEAFTIGVSVAASEEEVTHTLPVSVTSGGSVIYNALGKAMNGVSKAGRAARGLNYMPFVGQTVTGRCTIQYHGPSGGVGSFSGSFTGGDLAGEGYSGFLCLDPTAANPGTGGNSNAGNYTATCSATGDGWATFDVSITSDAGGPLGDINGDGLVEGYQRVGGSIRVEARNPMGNVILKKVSANPEYTDNNPAYNLTGAKYGLFTDLACTNQVDTLTVQSNSGLTNKSVDLEEGTYYTKELPGTATGYLVNNHVRALTVDAGVTDKVITLDGNMAEPNLDDPISLLVEKSFSDWDESGKLQGDVTTFEGIQFRIDYYANLYDSVEEAEESGQPNASAVFETDEDGFLYFRDATPVNGTTWPYKNSSSGKNTFPLGTVVITEVSALDGMNVMAPKAFTITANGTGTKITTLGTWPDQDTQDDPVGTYANEVWRGGVTVYKADADEHAQNPQGDGNFGGVQYEIINQSEYPVYVNDKEVPVGEVAMTIQTIHGEDSIWATTGKDALPYGSYTIREIAGNDSYNKAEWSQDFEIRSDEQMVTFGTPENWNEDEVKRGGIEITKADADTGISTPQGDAELANTSYDIYNRSKNKVYVNGAWYAKDDKIMTVETEWNETRNAYVASTGERVLPYGTYEIVETGAPVGYHKADYKQTVQIRQDGEIVQLKDAATNYNVDEVFRGGVSITKADADWHTSEPQGDATLAGNEYQIINRSQNAVFMRESMESYAPGEAVMTLKTEWNEEKQAYVASTAKSSLPYGTYEIVETKAAEGYNNAEWSATFTIRQEGEMHYFDRTEDGTSGPNSEYVFHHQWNENEVMRGGIIVGKVDRETGQYISLGEAHLDGAVFEIINRSKQPVYVNGETYDVGDVVMNITTEQMEWNEETIYAATTGNNVLPYGTYEVREIKSGEGYLYDSTSKAYTKTVQIRDEGQMVDLTDEADAVANQVLREDWHFKKKAEDSMERMDQIAFLVTSMTTGEQHVIVTDENGLWGSAWVPHTQNTNANDPDSPYSNGAIAVDEDGNWYVADSSKLTFDAGTWFTGMANDQVTWNEDGTYDVNGTTVNVNDEKRAFPYDTYKVQELRCENNEGYKLVNFTVTLHRYTADHDGPGLDIDYGTIDDARIAIGTTLTYGAFDKIAPATKDLVLRDTVTYNNLDVDASYVMKGELHLVNEDGTDGGVIAEAEKEFNSGTGVGSMTMEFTIDASELAGKSVVAFEYLTQDGAQIAEHEDITDENQTVKFPEIGTTLTGDLGHTANAGAETITLTDKVSYKNLEIGKEYTLTGTLMDQETGEAITDADGNPITATKTFVPVSEEGSTNVVFTFSGVDLAGKTVVAFEEVSKDGVLYAVHADIEDAAQTVYFPKVTTFAVDGADHNKDLAAGKTEVVVDGIRVENLVPSLKEVNEDDYEYKLAGELHIRNKDGSDGGALSNADGEKYKAELTWKGSDGTQTMTFENVDTRKLGGKDLVVYQTLYGRTAGKEDAKWVVLGEHKDISNDDQSVNIPKIDTVLLSDQELHESQVPENGNVTLNDAITYENLTPGHEYVVGGMLYVRDTNEDGEPVKGDAVGGKTPVTAYAQFTAEETDGTANVTFTFDATGLEGKSIVAYEYLFSSPAEEIPDDWDDVFGKPEGEPAKLTKENPDDSLMVAKHTSIKDEDQTIHFAEIGTTLTSNTGLHETQVPTGEDKTMTLTDTVSYKNLIPGREYTVSGTLHIQDQDKDGNIIDGGTVKDAEGNDVVGTTTFTPVTPNGEVEVIFTFDASELFGKTVVAFEEVSVENKVFAVHADIEDEAQAVHFVEIGTTGLAENGLHETQVPNGEDKTVTITDEVAYKNVIPGAEYTVTGTLHLQSVDADGNITDAGAIKDAEGNEVTASATFTAEKANGTANVEFTFDAAGLEGKTIVAFETLTREDKLVATHADITDEDQSIHFVDLGTTALADNGLHETQVPDGEDKTVTITDTIAYENVIPGVEYEVSGTLHVQEKDEDGNITDGGTIKDAEGNDLVAKAKFTPETANGTVDVEFTFDASELTGKTVVAFETLTRDGIEVAVHADITDDAQSVSFVKLGTTALAENGTHMTQVPSAEDKTVTIVDTVAYENLIPGATYKVSGTLHIQDVDEDGNIIDGGMVQGTNLVPADDQEESQAPAEGEEAAPASEETDAGLVEETSDLVAETVFTAEEANGTVDVTFTFDASELDGKTVVAFETLTRDDKVVGTHADITDEAQSVNFVRVRTRALAENGEHEFTLPAGDKTVTITDLVEYKNLIPGEEYTVTGILHVQNVDEAGVITDGGTVKDAKGEDLTSQVTFTAEEADGSVDVEFTFDASGLENKTVVAFESISYGEAVVATHEDITDEYQSVKFLPTPEETPDEPNILDEIVKTGQMPLFGILILLGIGLMAGGGYVYTRKRRG